MALEPSSSPVTRPISTTSGAGAGDGFTAEEVDRVLNPSDEDTWVPPRPYHEINIGSLIPGPQCVTILARIVNLHNQATPNTMPQASRGCIRLIVKDDTGAMTIRLWFAHKDYKLRLGQLVRLWTCHVSNGEPGAFASAPAPLFISMFPERDTSCHVHIHDADDEGVLCKTPLGHKPGQPLAGLMTLKTFIDGGHEIGTARILVCVQSIGARKKIIHRNGHPSTLVSIGVFDETAPAFLTLWDFAAAFSASHWTPASTILLITNPRLKPGAQPSLTPTASTLIDVNPTLRDASWLRAHARRLTQRNQVNPAASANLPSTHTIQSAPIRPLFTICSLDAAIRAAPATPLAGFLSVLVLGASLAVPYRRNMLLCAECSLCGTGSPVYASALAAACPRCAASVPLRVNPRVLARLADETGALEPAGLVWATGAWEDLLGRGAGALLDGGVEALRSLERRLLCARVTLVVAWGGDGDGARLAVMGVVR